MAGVLEKEAKERALNRVAIAALRRRSLMTPKTSQGKVFAASSTTTTPATHTSSPLAPPGSASTAPAAVLAPEKSARTIAAGRGTNNGYHFTKRPERRFRRLKSLPGSSSIERSSAPLPLARGKIGVLCNNTASSDRVSSSAHLVSSSSSSSASGNDGNGGSWGGDGREKERSGEGPTVVLWPSGGGDGASAGGMRRGQRGQRVPSGVTMADAIPARVSCGYCRKLFRIQILDRHEDRCPSRNPDLFATPCVACKLQGPRCACWALRNGLLKETRTEPEKPLFALFQNRRQGDGARKMGQQPPTSATATIGSSSIKGAASFLGGWNAAEGFRRPVPLMDDDSGSDHHNSDGDDWDVGGGKGAGEKGDRQSAKSSRGGRKTAESPEERWIRERDEWLFGRGGNRSKTDASSDSTTKPPLPPAPVCGSGGGSGHSGESSESGGENEREKEEHEAGGGLSGMESDEAFLLREQKETRKHLEKVRDAAKVRRYTEKWFRFSIDPPEKIRHGDVPWLPTLSKLDGGPILPGPMSRGCSARDGSRGGKQEEVLELERFETLGVNEGDSWDVKKAALRAASLRWHPDKFMSKYGSRIASEDRVSIGKDVQATMQRITRLRQRLHQQQAAAAAPVPSQACFDPS